MRSPGIRGISWIAAFVAVAAAIAATSFHLAQDGTGPADRAGAANPALEDPLAQELAHCRAIGMAAKDDVACGAAWAESQRRFFDYSPLSPDRAAR
jgi:conjugative transfer region protein TrbK